MSPAALAIPPAVEALAVIAGALWMTLAPQAMFASGHRALLGAITWAGSRALLVALAHANPAALWAALAADLVAWRALAALEGETGETAWAWAATPAVALFMLRAGPAPAATAAAIALGLALIERRAALAAGLVLGAAVAWGGGWLALAAAPLVLAQARRPVRAAALLVPLACGLVVGAMRSAAGAWPAPLAAPALGDGPTLWRLPVAFGFGPPVAVAGSVAAVAAVWGGALLLRRRAEAAALGAWGFGVLAALAPGVDEAHVVAWLPFLCAWCAGDPDRKGWWIVEGIALPLAIVLQRAALAGVHGPSWRGIAIATVAAAAVLALWPLRELHTKRPAGAQAQA